LTLLAKSFQTLFPPLSPKTLALSSARRVVLVSYNASTGTVDWRHYLITVKSHGVSKGVRRVVEGGGKKGKGRGVSRSKDVPDLGGEKDIADFVLRKKGGVGAGDYESGASSTEDEEEGEEGAAVSLAEDYVGRNNKKGQKKAVRLDEIGPRMELRLIKITEGVPGKEGAVLYHEFGER
jgi:ribosome biogenesis protein SSF1/2